MIKVAEVHMTTDFCPTQWEGVTDDGQLVYARFRWNCGYVDVGERQVVAWDGPPEKAFNGVCSYDELREATKDVIEWPPATPETLLPPYVRDGSVEGLGE
jgi:hypothetical protein